MPILLKFEHDYADEFDVYGFRVVSEETWEQLQEAIKRSEYPMEFYFGTNEEIIIEDEADALRAFTAKNVSDAEVEILKKFFSRYSGGMCYFGWDPIDQIFDDLSDKDHAEILGE